MGFHDNAGFCHQACMQHRRPTELSTALSNLQSHQNAMEGCYMPNRSCSIGALILLDTWQSLVTRACSFLRNHGRSPERPAG